MAKTWYPVINYAECTECGTCINKCTHGVFDTVKAPSPVVANPVACINRCHGCGDLCPQGAITYVGDDTGWTPPYGKIIQAVEACCCGSNSAEKHTVVDFLYLDLNTCERCMATDSIIDEAINELYGVLDTLGYTISVNKVNITSREMAKQYRFLSSPTIRVNGRDICADVRESDCKDCGDLCSSDVDCRVFFYDGVEYDHPPKAMIVDGILKAIYSPPQAFQEAPYVLPQNLETFFAVEKTSYCDGQCSCEGCT